MRRKGSAMWKSRIYDTLSGKVFGSDGVPQRGPGETPVYSMPKLTPQETARRQLLRICGLSGFRCRDHVNSRARCGRILRLSCVDASSASGAE